MAARILPLNVGVRPKKQLSHSTIYNNMFFALPHSFFFKCIVFYFRVYIKKSKNNSYFETELY